MDSTQAERPTLWTASVDYYATGEGRTVFAWIGYAMNEQECREGCGKALDPYFAKGAECVRGVARNEVTTLLWSAAALDLIEAAEHRANVLAHSMLHFNYS
jgi:hypothetical protein